MKYPKEAKHRGNIRPGEVTFIDEPRGLTTQYAIAGLLLLAVGAILAFGVAWWLTPPAPHWEEVPVRGGRP